ncbi:MAG: hypothetical protein LBU82_02060 [Treponema sp.]|jgi:hypothetical protein|nr:hypothetical protein [Treponema sp.]
MTDNLVREAEERFGIKADPDDIAKLRAYLLNAYGRFWKFKPSFNIT